MATLISQQQGQRKPISKLTQDLLAGTTGGWAQVLVGQPLDTIKVRLQTTQHAKGAMDCFRQLVTREGLPGFYRGVMSPLVGIGFCNAVMFMSNGYFRNLLQQPDDQLSIVRIGVAGSMAGWVMAFLNCPIELLKVKLQTQDPKGVIGLHGNLEPPFKGVIDCGIRSIRTQGLLGIYRGTWMTLLRDVPGYFGYFVCYEGTKRVFQSLKPNEQLSTSELLIAGGLSGIAAWIPSYPQDVIKSCYQNDPRYKTYRQVFYHILRMRGSRAFFVGIVPAMARAFPANAATFFVYEMTIQAMN
ncbi:MAG: mitochondrial carrier domain-containing protein [Benjaminiella poitrasii]|nr:MAG: mitochondrial carrier domain-containing protein [Benjaminiella poitrasii]